MMSFRRCAAARKWGFTAPSIPKAVSADIFLSSHNRGLSITSTVDFGGEDDFSNDKYKKELLSEYYDEVGPKYMKLAVRWSCSMKDANLVGLKEEDREKFCLHGLWPIPQRVLTLQQLKDNSRKIEFANSDNLFLLYEKQILKLWPDLKNPICLLAAQSFIVRKWKEHGRPAGISLGMYLYQGLAMMSAIPKDFGIPVGKEMKLSEASNYAREVLKNMHLFGEHIGANVAPEIRAVIDREDRSRPFVIEEIRVHLNRTVINGNGMYKVVDVYNKDYYTGKANNADNIVILPSKI